MSRIPVISLLLCIALSVYFLAIGIPHQVEEKKGHVAAIQAIPVETPLETKSISDAAFTIDSLRVKSSGEETYNETGFEEAKEEFRKRFGYGYDEPWEGQRATHHFSVTPALSGMVDFWTQVFGNYGKDQYIFHNRDDVSIVYSVVDLTGLDPLMAGITPEESDALKKAYLAEERERIRKLLKKLSVRVSGRQSLAEEETRIAELFHQNSALSIENASKDENIRVQGGFAHKMREAIALSGQYIPEFEKIFSRMGVPVELTRLPLIESAFKVDAYSSAAAAGLWQFIPDTGKRYLRMDENVDERYDPFLAAYAAAQHLLNEYKLLNSWPLTINAYNTGPQRMIKARQQLGTDDIAVIIKNFKEPAYQFYSRNYYPEFLAALHVYENQESYFGKIQKKPPLEYELFLPQGKVNLAALSRAMDMDDEILQTLNPALRKDILNGSRILPGGYMVRVPKNMGRLFARTALDYYENGNREAWHIVAQGETVDGLAKQYGVSAELLEDSNQVLRNETLTPGMALKIPAQTGVAMNPEEPAAAQSQIQ